MQIRWGSPAYGFIKKEDRSHKLSQRAYAAIFVGTDDTVLGAARLVPFILLKDGAIKLFKTKVTKTYQAFDGVYPLMLDKQCVYPDCAAEWMLGDELLAIEAAEATEEAGESHEVEKILAKNVYDTVTGACEYKCRFKGYSAEHDRWIDTEKLCCDELIAEYEAEQKGKQAEDVIAGCCAEDAADAAYQGCSCGFDGAQMCDECDAYMRGTNLYSEMDQREAQLAQVQEDFDAKIAYAYLHGCNPLEVTHELLCTDGGVEAYEDLYLQISLEHDPDGNDWNWVDAVLAQEAPAPEIDFVAGAIVKNSVSEPQLGADLGVTAEGNFRPNNSVEIFDSKNNSDSDDELPELETLVKSQELSLKSGLDTPAAEEPASEAPLEQSDGSESDGAIPALVDDDTYSGSDSDSESDEEIFEFEAAEQPKTEIHAQSEKLLTNEAASERDAVTALSALSAVFEMPEPEQIAENVEIGRDVQRESSHMTRAKAMMCAAAEYRADCAKAPAATVPKEKPEKMVTVTKGLSHCGPAAQTELKPTISEGAKRGEVSIKEASRPEFAAKLKAAIDRELREMDEKRFVKCPEPTDAEKANALEARFVLTVKNAEMMDWCFKARLVGKDLKRLRYCDPEDSYAPVPCQKLFRLLIAAAAGKRVSSADLVTAYLQAKGFVNADDFIWIKFWHPIYGIWMYKKLSGYIYGCIEPGHVWGRIFADWMVNALGFRECKNNGNVYALDFGDGIEGAEAATVAPESWTRLATRDVL